MTDPDTAPLAGGETGTPRFDLAEQVRVLGADSLLPPGYKPPKPPEVLNAIADKPGASND